MLFDIMRLSSNLNSHRRSWNRFSSIKNSKCRYARFRSNKMIYSRNWIALRIFLEAENFSRSKDKSSTVNGFTPLTNMYVYLHVHIILFLRWKKLQSQQLSTHKKKLISAEISILWWLSCCWDLQCKALLISFIILLIDQHQHWPMIARLSGVYNKYFRIWFV